MKFFLVILFVPLVLESTTPETTGHPKFDKAHVLMSFPVCGNCSKIRNFQRNSGFFCHYEDEKAVTQRFGTPTNQFPDCLPSSYMVTSKISKYCCFWSAELGCSALIGRQLYDKKNDYCGTCKRHCIGLKHEDLGMDGNNRISGYRYLIALAFFVVLGMC
ncbi:uncharacterized protein LOC108052947 [Drosophila rhopaloa]|uniref:Protein sleepless n=1 Tax=Drosophila rhopaloa TaxID=1041015 RepID=A0ABM5I6Q2_DRORH|nr:uncharacterized protein LOC108052947 [Drosophila rhopaloa]